MIAVGDRRDGWVGLNTARKDYTRAFGRMVKGFQLERNGALFRVHGVVRPKKRLTQPTLLEMA